MPEQSAHIEVNSTEPTTAQPSMVIVKLGNLVITLPAEGARQLGTRLIGYAMLTDVANGELAPADDDHTDGAPSIIVPGG